MKFWLSFVDPDLPEGNRFLGCSIVEAPNVPAAMSVAWAMGCNPGGEMQGTDLGPDIAIPDEFMNRLLDKAEIARLEGIVQGGRH